MPRPRIPRRILTPPRFLHFKPVGVPRRQLDTVRVTVDEAEAIRLADHEGLDHQPASERMGISRSTFTRLLEAAHGKIARCIIEGCELVIEGGDVDFEHSLVRCKDCGVERITDANPGDELTDEETPCGSCGSENTEDLARIALRGHLRGRGEGRNRHGRNIGPERREQS
ncbi:MAG: DUF134 domain-containing protein [Bacteroidota bacterium]|nr:DUF134 domain-containing protein [Bacteroidota bacterium]